MGGAADLGPALSAWLASTARGVGPANLGTRALPLLVRAAEAGGKGCLEGIRLDVRYGMEGEVLSLLYTFSG